MGRIADCTFSHYTILKSALGVLFVDEMPTLPAGPVEELTVLPVANPAAELPPAAGAPGRLSLGLWTANFLAVALPLLGLGAAAIFLWGWGFSWTDLGLMLGMYVLTALGITVGFHRLFTHRSFETYRGVQLVLGVLGSMAAEGSLLKWVALHRRHHQHSDRPGDPHSPHLHGRGPWAWCAASGMLTWAGCFGPTLRTWIATSGISARAGPCVW
jgi:fatty acid desaturase